jgi:hypothetical protein
LYMYLHFSYKVFSLSSSLSKPPKQRERYRITNKLRYLYILLRILFTPLKTKALRFKSPETPCPTFCKCLHFH